LKTTITLILIFLLGTDVFADASCFIAKDGETILKQEGDCITRHSPFSTFKVAISLMGYNEGILIDPIHPELPFKPEYIDIYASWRKPHNPTTWLQNSCIWYSQIITKQLGLNKFKEYLYKFNYGNQDPSGDKGQDNGLTNCWLSSSLQISPIEQVNFLEKLIANKLPVNNQAQEFTKIIMYVETLPNGWKLYGKTGGGYKLDASGMLKENSAIGWFVGWVEYGERKIIFVRYLESDHRSSIPLGNQAKIQARKKLLKLINNK
jgi:beta-lactamase class D